MGAFLLAFTDGTIMFIYDITLRPEGKAEKIPPENFQIRIVPRMTIVYDQAAEISLEGGEKRAPPAAGTPIFREGRGRPSFPAGG